MIADNFWKFLAVVILIAGLFFWYKKSSEKKSFKRTTAALAELVAFNDESKARNDEEAGERFVAALALLHKAEAKGIDTGVLFDAVHEYNDISKDSGMARLVEEALRTGLSTARKLNILDAESIWNLEDGIMVKVQEGPYKGEPIRVTQQVPAQIAEGARYFIGNLMIVPDSVASVYQDIVVTPEMLTTAVSLQNADIITKLEAKAIREALYAQRDKMKKR